MLQQGSFVADVLYCFGEGAPNTLPYGAGLSPRMPKGYDYDGCDASAVMTLRVEDGRLVLPSGMSYRVLVLPNNKKVTPEFARKIRDLVAAGATVVGDMPVASPSLMNHEWADAEVRRIADEVWGDDVGLYPAESTFGKGRVFFGIESLEDVFDWINLGPDFQYTSLSGGSKLAYIHRTIGDADVYFVSNQQYRSTDAVCEFRVRNRVPELWHPDTGLTEEAPLWSSSRSSTSVQLHLGPAESVFLVMRRAGSRSGLTRMVTSLQVDGNGLPKIEIKSARYEAPDGRGADVTEIVRQIVREGTFEIQASNGVFGDPVVNVVKQLTIVYTLDGKEMRQTVPENDVIELIEIPDMPVKIAPYFLRGTGRDLEVAAFEQFSYYLAENWPDFLVTPFPRGVAHFSQSKQSVPANELTISGPWSVSFAKGWGAQERATFDALASWSERADPGIKYFSGSAVYTKSFDVPSSLLQGDRLVLLDLGRVKNFATVTLNGKDLGVLWKEPFVVDVTEAVRAGRNELKIKVTNLWVNRIIGDEQLPADVEWNGAQLARWPEWLVEGRPRPSGRFTFTTWKFWDKDSPLLESGLLGPVVLRSARWVRLP
jgi:hypothetical protein